MKSLSNSGARRRSANFTGRPFRASSIWNVPIPAGATRASWIAPWSSSTNYAIGDCASFTSGTENYIYRSLTGGVNKALPTGQTSNTDWSYHGASMSQWYSADAGTPLHFAATSDPVWQLRFNTSAYSNLAGGTWTRNITDATLSNNIWNSGSTLSTFPTNYNSYLTVSTSSLVPPATGTYDPKGSSQTDAMLLPSKQIYIPAGALPSQGATDWTMVIHQPDGTVLEMMAAAMLTGNRIVCGSYKITRPSLSGDGWQNGFRASMIPGYAGLITQAEWATAWQADIDSAGVSGNIDHALAFLAPNTLLKQVANYPALSWDSQADGAYTGTKFAMGQRIALPANYAMTTSDFTDANGRFARIIGRTMKIHGAILVDRGGSGLSVLHQYTSDTSSTSQVLRSGGGSINSFRNDQMLRKILINTELISFGPEYYVTSN